MMNFIFATAQAQEATGPAAGQPNPMMQFVPFAIVFAIFYFLLIRPQKKKLQLEQQMLSQLTKGDEVYTKAGVLGTITGLTDKIVTLEVSDGVKLKMLRGQVAGKSEAIFSANKTEK